MFVPADIVMKMITAALIVITTSSNSTRKSAMNQMILVTEGIVIKMMRPTNMMMRITVGTIIVIKGDSSVLE